MLKQELIGSEIRIIHSSNPDLVNLKGRIIDETKNMIVLETEKGIKKIIKNQIKMEIKTQTKTIEIEGKDLVEKPEERNKK